MTFLDLLHWWCKNFNFPASRKHENEIWESLTLFFLHWIIRHPFACVSCWVRIFKKALLYRSPSGPDTVSHGKTDFCFHNSPNEKNIVEQSTRWSLCLCVSNEQFVFKLSLSANVWMRTTLLFHIHENSSLELMTLNQTSSLFCCCGKCSENIFIF